MPITAFMAFMADAPLIGLDPHPGYSPDPNIESFDANGYFKALGASLTRDEVLAEIKEDREAALQAYDAGDLEDVAEPDVVYQVVIHDDGTVQVFDADHPDSEVARYTMARIYWAFGMEMPQP